MANLKDLIVNGAARIIGKVYASEFVGKLTGNADSATKATKDSADQPINTTYIKGLSVSGKTITYTKGDGTPGTITTQDTNTTYSIDSGDNNGQIKVTPSSGTPYNVSVKGLGSRAYDSTSYLPLAGGVLDGHLDIHASNNTAGSYDEGIRIAVGKNGYSTLALGTSSSSTTGTIDGQWWLGCNLGSFGRKLFITHNGSDTSETYFYADSSSQITPSLKVGGTIQTRENTGPALVLRNNSSYMSTINYDTSGNEALAINLKSSVTSFMVNHGVDGSQWTANGKWTGVTPTLQAKNKCVYINEFIPNDTSPSYNLKVNGTSYFSNKVYIGSSSSYISYNSSTGALEFNC